MAGWIFVAVSRRKCNHAVLAAADLDLTLRTWRDSDPCQPRGQRRHRGDANRRLVLSGRRQRRLQDLRAAKAQASYGEGFQRQALLMTIVRDHNDQGHAILTVRTNSGDFILDNLTDEIRPWEATGYRFVKRQSQEDPNVWVAIVNPKELRQVSSH
jgi:transglutaminase-like cysteine proteinase BTLCP